MSDSKDQKLDLTSSDFDPLLALYSSNVVLPCPSAPVLDNMSRFEESDDGVRVKPVAAPKKTEKPKPVVSEFSTDGWNNVVNWMKNVQGPLSVIRDSIERRIKVKVVTRNAEGIRGFALGYITAFDRMWNLALEDVTEIWTRKKRKKIPALGPATICPVAAPRMETPVVKVTPIDRKRERCERHVPQMLMRGEHVVLVSIVDFWTTAMP